MHFTSSDLEVFCAVAASGSFSRAATSLRLSQPSVSERVRRLERSIGTPLFERVSTGARLTASGEAFLPFAKRCLSLAGEGRDIARDRAGASSLRIVAHASYASRVAPLLASVLSALRCQIKLRDAHSEEIPLLLLDGLADVGFLLPTALPSGLSRVRLPADPSSGSGSDPSIRQEAHNRRVRARRCDGRIDALGRPRSLPH